MDVLEIGTITLFTNVNDNQKYLFDEALNDEVSKALVNWVKKELENRFPKNDIIIIEYKTEVGCIITPILIGILLKTTAATATATAVGTGLTIAGVGGATYKVITDYDKIKKNIKSIGEDAKNLWIRVFHRKKKTERKEDVPSEQKVEVYDEMPDDLKKYYSAGQDVVIVSEKEILTNHKVCIIRDDIKEEITKETYTKEVRKIDTKKQK